MIRPIAYLLLSLTVCESVLSLRLPATLVRRAGDGFSVSRLQSSSATSAAAGSSGTEELTNYGDDLYAVNMTIGGVEFTVQLDSGSSDLWVALQDGQTLHDIVPSNASDVTLQYSVGEASGKIEFGPATLGPYHMQSQAFILVSDTKNFGDNLFSRGVRGILGLAPTYAYDLSAIRSALDNSTAGYNVLENIFAQSPDQPNFLTVALARTDDSESVSGGVFTISEYAEGLEAVAQMPQLPTVAPESLAVARWAVELDGMTVNGKSIPLSSTFANNPSGKAVAMLDTGYTLPQVPKYMADAIYSVVDGAYYSGTHKTWYVPCTGSYPNVSFIFAGHEYPIDPLDLSVVYETSDGDGTYCVNYYQIKVSGGCCDDVDVVLGDGFLRNVYASFDYGKFDDRAWKLVENPFVQLLSTTDANAAAAAFAPQRAKTLASQPPEISNARLKALAGVSGGGSDDDNSDAAVAPSNSRISSADSVADPSDAMQQLVDAMHVYGPAAVGLLAGIFIIMLGLLVVAVSMYIRRGARAGPTRTAGPTYAPVPIKEHEQEGVRFGGAVVPELRYSD